MGEASSPISPAPSHQSPPAITSQPNRLGTSPHSSPALAPGNCATAAAPIQVLQPREARLNPPVSDEQTQKLIAHPSANASYIVKRRSGSRTTELRQPGNKP